MTAGTGVWHKFRKLAIRPILAVDVTERFSIQFLRDAILSEHGRIYNLVSCAGANSAVEYSQIDDTDWDRELDTNLRSAHWGCPVFGQRMVQSDRGGPILSIGSVTSFLPLSRVFAYSASKAAVGNNTHMWQPLCLLAVTIVLLRASTALADPGHGTENQSESLWRYFVEPTHAVTILAVVLMLGSVQQLRKRARSSYTRFWPMSTQQ